MKRLLFFCGLVIAARPVDAHKPGELTPLLCSIEQGKYFVTVETAVGPRRFAFDTGCPQTIVCEKPCNELRLVETGRKEIGDFEGFRASVTTARLPYLQMGGTSFRNRPVTVLPDSSYLFRCLRADGIVGCDLLGRFAVRFTDSTLTLAHDYRDFGELDRKKALRIYSDKQPIFAFRAGSDKAEMDFYALFDSGSSTYFSCRYSECSALIERGILHDVRQVGQIWDESLAEIVSPGDRVLRMGTLDVSEIDPCAFIRREIQSNKPEITVQRKDGTIVTVPIRNL